VANSVKKNVMWFRRDLRLADNEALCAAASNAEVVPLFVLDPRFLATSGAARLAFLFRSLRSLNEQLGGALVVRTGNPQEIVAAVAKESGADAVFFAKDFAPYGMQRDAQVVAHLHSKGIKANQVGSAYAVEPGSVRKNDGTPYAVFTPFSKIWMQIGWPAPFATPKVKWAGAPTIATEDIPSDPQCSASLPEASEQAAWNIWESFRDTALDTYNDTRNNPDISGTSKLSPYLRFGLIHPRSLLAELNETKAHAVYRSELGWREFYADVLFHQPRTVRENLQRKMDAMVLNTDDRARELFALWCEGKTGYPIVDAGMKQLLATGWMHNRVRMIVASFLVKDLHLPWQWGAKYFMQHLVDGDIASNQHGWQWTAGTGTDASPYFRIFNPISQGEKFDPNGDYVRTWIPELADVPNDVVHAPWLSGLLNPYIEPIVDHATEREVSLLRYKQLSVS
jgi:deoxyribodipyrimidine photo-lyase